MRLLDVPRRERVERHPHHLHAALAHVHEAVHHGALRVEMARELRELGDGDALVAHALDVDRRVEQREDEPQVGRDRGLAREHELDLVLDRHVPVVDLVVERDHLVAQLDVLRPRARRRRRGSRARTTSPISWKLASSESRSAWSSVLIRTAR